MRLVQDLFEGEGKEIEGEKSGYRVLILLALLGFRGTRTWWRDFRNFFQRSEHLIADFISQGIDRSRILLNIGGIDRRKDWRVFTCE